MSGFATMRSEQAKADALADPASLEDVDEHDPASVRRWMRKMGKEFGGEGEDVDEAIDQTLDSGPDGEGESEGAGAPEDF